jgi:hypothetical protein
MKQRLYLTVLYNLIIYIKHNTSHAKMEEVGGGEGGGVGGGRGGEEGGRGGGGRGNDNNNSHELHCNCK